MFSFDHQTRIISGVGAIDEVAEQAKGLGSKVAMLVCTPFFNESETVDKIITNLKDAQIDVIQFSKVQPNPRDYDCEEGAKLAIDHQVDLIIGLGGGSALDEAKAIAALITNGGKCSDWDARDLEQPMLANICIPTTAGTGAEVTFCAVIDDTKRNFKMAMFDPINLIPTVAILDPNLTVTLPKSTIAGPGMDVLTHAIEAYTVKSHNPISDTLALEAIRLVKANLPVAFNDPENIQARENMLNASAMAGMAFINANVGAVHALSETLGAKYGLPHGLTNALLLEPIVEYSMDADWQRYANIGEAMGVNADGKSVDEVAREGVIALHKFIEQFAFPDLASFEKFDASDFADIAATAMQNDLTADNAKPLTEDAYVQILKKAFNL
ncbi:iron-containing alcohol dehydrogenase [Weissella minor]|uniref:iron-containing alcohol dehydrogenase n=1 Tax=Weissella minor TaxID=1620 RepID=UPI001BAE6A64|nr:iron-containing alcohol dehydrogenase [Weissella minor]MBS0948804.1 iron-containing alcohol dehydrogenase [Weissella minor]